LYQIQIHQKLIFMNYLNEIQLKKCQRTTSGLAKLGGKVITQAVLRRTTVRESSSCTQARVR